MNTVKYLFAPYVSVYLLSLTLACCILWFIYFQAWRGLFCIKDMSCRYTDYSLVCLQGSVSIHKAKLKLFIIIHLIIILNILMAPIRTLPCLSTPYFLIHRHWKKTQPFSSDGDWAKCNWTLLQSLLSS